MNVSNELHGATAHFANIKILIIDDEPANVALLEAMLSDSGYDHVKSIMDPRLALETCKTFAPDLILLDLIMPHLDGFAVLEALRSRGNEMFLPVIVLTADVNDESKYRGFRAGATDYLLKPFDQIEVLMRMSLFVERRRIEHDLRQQKEKAETTKDRFLAMASHELRTPLTPVLAWASGTANKLFGTCFGTLANLRRTKEVFPFGRTTAPLIGSASRSATAARELSKAIIEMHGGTIHARSEDLSKGAIFVIDLPTNRTAPGSRRAGLPKQTARCNQILPTR